MINEAFLDVTSQGDANSRVFTFPVQPITLVKILTRTTVSLILYGRSLLNTKFLTLQISLLPTSPWMTQDQCVAASDSIPGNSKKKEVASIEPIH